MDLLLVHFHVCWTRARMKGLAHQGRTDVGTCRGAAMFAEARSGGHKVHTVRKEDVWKSFPT